MVRAGQARKAECRGLRTPQGAALIATSRLGALGVFRKRDDYFRHFTALDVGTELVKALIVRREQPDGVVIGVGHAPQMRGAMSGGAIADIEAVIQSCNRALEAAEDMANTVPGQVVVGVAGELVKGFSSSISYPRSRPQGAIRESELRNLLQLVEKRAVRQAQHLLELERGYGDLEPKLVHSAISNVRIDGYPVTNPVGFQGRNLEVNVFNTFAPMAHVAAIETVIRELDLELLGAVAQPYAVARACADTEAWEQGAIYVDVGGGTTDVALIRDGGLEGTRMFNLGGRAFTRRLAQALGLSFEDAEVRKLRHAEGLLPKDMEQRVHSLVRPDVEVLLEGLGLCLRELARGEHLPSQLYLCGGGSLLPELMDELNRGKWAEGLPFTQAPKARWLYPKDVQGIVDTTEQLVSPRDVGPLALANHGMRADEEDRDLVNSLMRGVLKAIKV